MAEDAGANVTYTVKEMLSIMDSKLDTKLSSLDSKLEVTLSKLEDKADRSRVHDLANVVTTKANFKDVDDQRKRIDSLEAYRNRLVGAVAVVGAVASAGAFHIFLG
jgi:hypothetical protein